MLTFRKSEKQIQYILIYFLFLSIHLEQSRKIACISVNFSTSFLKHYYNQLTMYMLTSYKDCFSTQVSLFVVFKKSSSWWQWKAPKLLIMTMYIVTRENMLTNNTSIAMEWLFHSELWNVLSPTLNMLFNLPWSTREIHP